jgi:hypothetical protein
LGALVPADAAARDDVRRARAYFAVHAARMAYPAFRARCLPIGSGAIESTAKNLIQQRQTQAGMRWTRVGAQRLASLRALQRSGRWDRFWQSQPLARLRRLRAPAARPGSPAAHTSAAAITARRPTTAAPAPAAARIATAGKPWAKGTTYWRRTPISHQQPA